MTKQNGVDVWPNAAIWMRDELRSKIKVAAVAFNVQILVFIQYETRSQAVARIVDHTNSQ